MSQLGRPLITLAMAVGLGAALTAALGARDAVGYPTTAVSLSANPVVATGGTVESGSTSTFLTAPADQRVILTDVVITLHGYSGSTSPCTTRVSIDSGGGVLAEYRLSSDTYYNGYYLQPTVISHSYRSGLPVEPGNTVGVTNHDSPCAVSYSVSGYYAQP